MSAVYQDSSAYRNHGYEGGFGLFAGRMTQGVKALLIANAGVFVLQMLFDRGRFMTDNFGLISYDVYNGRVYQLVTYMFLHGGPMHLLFNMLGLFFLGPETERGMGTRRFLTLYFLGGILGGLGWILLPGEGIPCVGASGAVFAVICAFATLYPHREITLLLFLVIPVRMRAWVLAAGLMLLQLLYLVGHAGGNIAYMVHLAGGLAGLIYTLVQCRPGFLPRIRRRSSPSWRRRVHGEPPPLRPDPSAEVDQLLDKIAEQGIGSLTKKERALLERASRNKSSR